MLETGGLNYVEYQEIAEQVPGKIDKFVLKHKTDASRNKMFTRYIEDDGSSRNVLWVGDGLPMALGMELDDAKKFELAKRYPLTHLNTVLNA